MLNSQHRISVSRSKTWSQSPWVHTAGAPGPDFCSRHRISHLTQPAVSLISDSAHSQETKTHLKMINVHHWKKNVQHSLSPRVLLFNRQKIFANTDDSRRKKSAFCCVYCENKTSPQRNHRTGEEKTSHDGPFFFQTREHTGTEKSMDRWTCG